MMFSKKFQIQPPPSLYLVISKNMFYSLVIFLQMWAPLRRNILFESSPRNSWHWVILTYISAPVRWRLWASKPSSALLGSDGGPEVDVSHRLKAEEEQLQQEAAPLRGRRASRHTLSVHPCPTTEKENFSQNRQTASDFNSQ